ncbi:hypothetical protein [Clavibacter michiganensis]|uniref:AbiTii domain-containing protein n=1 Tax=Clavibacter michiganensis TaxID=28447 RepID=UPI00345D6BAB
MREVCLACAMGRRDDALSLAEEVLADVELKRLKASEVVLKASRVARLVGHDELSEFLSCERNGYTGSESRWITLAGRRAESEPGKYYPQSIAKVDANIEAAREAIQALRGGGTYSGDYIAIAAREHDRRIASHAATVGLWLGIAGQVIAAIYDIVAKIYHELLFSELQATLFADTQVRIDGSLSQASGSALDKIERVSDRLRDGDPESVSQALVTCRRLIDSCADFVFPARADTYSIGDEAVLAVGQQNVLNRLQAFAHQRGASKARRDRLRRTLSDLYGRCSAGAHADVTVDEARFVFLQTYVVLGEVLALRD